jgi:hypothetical protein
MRLVVYNLYDLFLLPEKMLFNLTNLFFKPTSIFKQKCLCILKFDLMLILKELIESLKIFQLSYTRI